MITNTIPLLEAQNISKSFYQPHQLTLFENISLSLMPGESIAIVGRSGEGKSTLLQILGTLEDASSGRLLIKGKEVLASNCHTIRNQNIGFVFQSFHLLEDYTVLENVLMPARIGRHPTGGGSKMEKWAYELLQRVGLSDRALFQIKLLSGGEKQRVALARAMCNNPDIILADEPSGNLDSYNAQMIHEILLSFAQDQQKSLLLVTHDPQLARLCTHHYELHSKKLMTIS